MELQIDSITLKIKVRECLRGLEQKIQKYVYLAYWLFGAKGTWKTTGAKKALWPPLFFLKTGDETHVKDALLAPAVKEHSYHQRQGIEAKKRMYKPG